MTDYDAIIIGSGAGGLSAAVPLAQAGLKVLVCEQHEVPGGWTHSFTLQGYKFSPGVHYIGGIQPGGSMRKIYQGLGVSKDLSFVEINPEGYDHIFIGEQRFDFPKGKENLLNYLKERFPHEAEGLDGYFETVDLLTEGIRSIGRVKKGVKDAIRGAGLVPGLLRWTRATGQDLIEQYISDPVLKGVLGGQAGDNGLPPSQVSAFFQAGITHHYYEGGYYPVGGAFALPRAFTRALKDAGGELRLSTAVDEILIEDGRAVGVRLADGTEARSHYVISNADPEVTLGKLVGREHLSPRLRRKLDSVTYSVSALSLFFATDMDLREAGLDSGNFWYYDNEDVDDLYALGLTDHALHAETPPMQFLTVTTLKDPSKMHSGHHTCEAFTFVGYEAFEKWAHTKFEQRPADYAALKEDLAWRLFKGLDKRVPGLSKHIVFWDLGTPLTNVYYLNATRGNLYGISKTPRQIGPWAFPVKSEIEGLYMVGASTTSHGVAGVTQSGLNCAKRILGVSTGELLNQNGREIEIYPSEDISKWPEHLQKKIANDGLKK
jgi:phytoene dehydrogenase-like protein